MRTLERAWRAGKSEWRNHLTSALGAAVAFLCLTFALISTVNLRDLQQRWQHSGRISVYLSPGATDPQVQQLRAALLGSEGVVQAEFVSSEQARAELLSDVQNPLLEALPQEAFPPSIEVTLGAEVASQRTEPIALSLSKLPAVESVQTYSGWSRRIGELVGAASTVAWVLMAVVFLAVTAVVAATTQLALQRRREEVEVLRFVGATSAYVRAPFLVEGAAQGALGAVSALAMAGIAFGLVRRTFGDQFVLLLGVQPSFLPWSMCFGLVLCGGLLGAVAAFISLRRSFVS